MNKIKLRNTMEKAAAICFLMLSVLSVFAQKANEDVIIIDAYNPTISDAFKINENPKITDTVIEKPLLKYSINSQVINTTFDLEQIKPAKIVGEPLVKLYRSYFKIGMGTKTTPLCEIYYNNLRSSKYSAGAYFKHLSSSGKIKDYAFPGFSDNEASAYANRFFKNNTLGANMDILRSVVHYYGYKPATDDTLSKDDIKQRFLKAGGALQFYSTYHDSSRLNYSFKLKYYNLSEINKVVEDYIYFYGGINKNVEFLGKTIKNQTFGIESVTDYYNNNLKTDTLSGGTIKLQPYLSADYSILKIRAKMNIVFQISDDSKAKINPDLNVSLNIADNAFVIFAGYLGDQYRNNLIDISTINPYINTKTPLLFSNKKSELFGGFKGSLSSNISYNASFSKSRTENMPLFVNDTSFAEKNLFTLIYDDVKKFNIRAEFSYQHMEKYKILFTTNYYQYVTSNEIQAWHIPNIDIKLAINYNLKNKIIAKAEIIAYGKSYARLFDDKNKPYASSLKGTTDFNLGLEYRYSKILSGFINLNNIGAARYQRWYNYPSYGFTILGGITYAL